MSETIVIRTASPRDITLDECSQIADAVRKLSSDFDVRVEGQDRTGLGVTWFEVLRISLLGAAFGLGKTFAEEVTKKIADICVEWARKRFKEHKSKSKRPVYIAIYVPDGLIKSVVIKNATEEPEDRTDQDQKLARSVETAKSVQNTVPTSPNCAGYHLCPSCGKKKECAFGVCAIEGEVKCDSCLYVEEYGPKAADIIEKAIAVAAKLDDAAHHLSQFVRADGPQPWATREDARIWMNEAHDVLEDLDNALNRIHLRLKARNPQLHKS